MEDPKDTSVVSDASEGLAVDWIEELKRDFQDDITRGTYVGLATLDPAARDRVLECQARACVDAFVKLYDIPADLDFDEFLERMRIGGPSRVEIERDGDVIFWRELHEGSCMCPLVSRGVVEPNDGLCACATHWLRMLVERHAHREARVELTGSVVAGGQDCVFRIEIGRPIGAVTDDS